MRNFQIQLISKFMAYTIFFLHFLRNLIWWRCGIVISFVGTVHSSPIDLLYVCKHHTSRNKLSRRLRLINRQNRFVFDEPRHAYEMLGHSIDVSFFCHKCWAAAIKNNNNKKYKNVALKTIVPFYFNATSFTLVHGGVHDS